MDTSREFQQVLEKQKKQIPITYRDAAIAIGNDTATLLKYLCDNDYTQVHKLLHLSDSAMVMGKNAPFAPDKKRVEAELRTLLIRKQWKPLNQVVDHFVINLQTDNYTTNQELLQCMLDIHIITSTQHGYEFNVVLS